jgi:CheY-like chemotaxis protein
LTPAADGPRPGPLRVLLVEDTEERQRVLTALYRAHAWVLVNTGRRAVTLLKAYDFDVVSLDYNLRGELTGADVAEALARSRNRSARVVIHSQNPIGAEKIAQRLPGAVFYPVSRVVRSNQTARRLRAAIDQFGVAFAWTCDSTGGMR